jgi:hypothetical protein
MAIGTPTIARGSVPIKVFATSPIRLTAIKPTAILCPHSARRQSPIAAIAQQIETAKSRATANGPSSERCLNARGLTRHIGSIMVAGKSRDAPAVKLMRAPAKKKMLSALIPRGRCRRFTVCFGVTTHYSEGRSSFRERQRMRGWAELRVEITSEVC